MAVFTLEDELSVWANLGKHSSFVSGITDEHKIYYPSGRTAVSCVVRLGRRSREAIVRIMTAMSHGIEVTKEKRRTPSAVRVRLMATPF